MIFSHSNELMLLFWLSLPPGLYFTFFSRKIYTKSHRNRIVFKVFLNAPLFIYWLLALIIFPDDWESLVNQYYVCFDFNVSFLDVKYHT